MTGTSQGTQKPRSESYMWLYCASGDTDKPIILYEYQPGRGAKHPKEFLTGFKGYLHIDGYAGYHNLPEEIMVAGCWAHTRRRIDEAVKSLPKGKAKGVFATQGLAHRQKLFDLERQFAEPFLGRISCLPTRPREQKGVPLFSIIQTAIENGVDSYRYLRYLLHAVPNMDLKDAFAVTALLPENAPMECRSSASK